MKSLKVSLAAMMIALFTVVSANNAQAQTATVGQLLTGLLNVNIGAIVVEVDDVEVLSDNFVLVNVEDVLNDNNIEFLNNSINNNSILSDIQVTITNLLQNADIITDNQIVVGVLSGGQIVLQDI